MPGRLQLHNRVELVRYAIEHGLADGGERPARLPGRLTTGQRASEIYRLA